MTSKADAREQLLQRVMASAASDGITGRSLREIAAGVGSSHRMLLYHFGSREGLLAAVVEEMEHQQRRFMMELAARATTPRELLFGIWAQLSQDDLRPFVRMFFEVFGMVARGEPGTEDLRATLTAPWLAEAAVAAAAVGAPADPAELRMGVAVTRGLLMDLVAGADPDEVDAAYRRFVESSQLASDQRLGASRGSEN